MVVIVFMVVIMMLLFVQGVAFVTLCERHLLGGRQQRVGPNKVRFFGLVQPIFDGVKLIKKEQLFSFHSSNVFFLLIPGVTFIVMYLEWYVMYYMFEFFSMDLGILFFLCLLGFSVYSFLLTGVVRKSKYGVVGALRARNQSVSYEIAFRLYLICVMIMWGMYIFIPTGSVVMVFFFLPLLVMILAELNRAPFDFSEGERELVRGYNIEFGSVAYALLYIGEYGRLLFFSVLYSVFFLGFRVFGIYVVFRIFIFVRSSFPRFRYDMIIGIFWFVFLPVSLYLVSYFFFLVYY